MVTKTKVLIREHWFTLVFCSVVAVGVFWIDLSETEFTSKEPVWQDVATCAGVYHATKQMWAPILVRVREFGGKFIDGIPIMMSVSDEIKNSDFDQAVLDRFTPYCRRLHAHDHRLANSN